MKDWRKYTAQEFCLNVTDGTHDSPKPTEVGHYLITSKHLQNNAIDFSSAYKISEEDYQKVIKRSAVVQHDILFSMIGTIGNIVRVKDPIIDYAVKNMAIFKMGSDELKSKWLYYWLKSSKAKEYISSRLAGSTQSYLTLETLRNFPVFAPSEKEMQKIVSILSSIDDKIELNRQINDNLEQQIQTLYREWFIDNPKTEWATIALSEVATFVSGYSYKGNELVDSSETAMATIKNFERNGGFKLDGYKPVSPSSKLKEEQHAELFDILVAHTDLTQNAEVIGNAEIILSKNSYSDVIFSMDLVKVVAKESFPYQFLLALLLKNPVFKSHCIGYVNGTTVLHMNKRALPDFNTQIPNCEDAARMNEIAKSIFTKMSENLSEIANLTKLRDSLLPKLMSGELKINEIDC